MFQKIKVYLIFIVVAALLLGLVFGADFLYDSYGVNSAVKKSQQVQKKSSPVAIQSNSQQVNEKPKSNNIQPQNNHIQMDMPAPYFTNGFDWTLPENTKVESNSGLIEEYDSGLDYVNNLFKALRWDEINPKQGVYEFSKFDRWLKSIGSKKALIRLEVNSSCEAPKWALKSLRQSRQKSLIFWDKSYIKALKPLIDAFAKRYANHPQIAGVHLGIGDGEYSGDCDFSNKDGWGEFWMSPAVLAEAQDNFGLTPDLFEKRTLEIIEVYRSAFKSNIGKLVFTNISSSFSWDEIGKPYNRKLFSISKKVLKQGLGGRDGQVEIWMRYLDKLYGEIFISMPDGTCALGFDETFAESVEGRYRGTENEFYGDKDFVKNFHGPYKNQPYRFLISSLRSLQMRRNYASISGKDMKLLSHPNYKTQDFSRYLTKVMGKQKSNTPDVFVLLGERYVAASNARDHSNEACVKNKNSVSIRSFGRWLTESSDSQAAIKISMPKAEKYWGQDYYLPDGIDYEYMARQSNLFSFNLNDRLSEIRCKNGCRAEIKATFKDTVKTTMFVRLAEGVSQGISTLGDNKIKTVTFPVNSKFNNGLFFKGNKSEDFMIENSGKQLPLILIRMNFL